MRDTIYKKKLQMHLKSCNLNTVVNRFHPALHIFYNFNLINVVDKSGDKRE